MASDPEYRLLTAEEFLRIDFGSDMKAELDEGVIRMMGGATRAHSRVQVRLARYLETMLSGSGCVPHGSDMAVRTHDRSVRYPDLTIDCGAPNDRPDDLALSDPRVVIEILSPSTRRTDLGIKLAEYRLIATVAAVAFIDPDNETVAVTYRTVAGGWTDLNFRPDTDLSLPSLDLAIPHAEIFARD